MSLNPHQFFQKAMKVKPKSKLNSFAIIDESPLMSGELIFKYLDIIGSTDKEKKHLRTLTVRAIFNLKDNENIRIAIPLDELKEFTLPGGKINA